MKLQVLVTTAFSLAVAGVKRYIQKLNRLFVSIKVFRRKQKLDPQSWDLRKLHKPAARLSGRASSFRAPK
jgi:hypothetical protein